MTENGDLLGGLGAPAPFTLETTGPTPTQPGVHVQRDVLDPPLRSPQEMAYYRLFQRELAGIDAQHLIGRFAEW